MIRSIVIVAVMVLINFAMIFAIFSMAKKTNNNMKRFFLDNAGDYFKNQEGIEVNKEDKVEEKIVEVEKVRPVYQFNETKTADYKYTSFKDDYKSLKEELDKNINKEDIILEVIDNNKDNEQDKFAKAIFKINEEFEFDTIYELSTLTTEKQLEVLKDVFDEKQVEFLDDYISKVDGKFDIIAFFNHVNDQAKLLDENYYVKTGWNEENFDELHKKVVTVHDDEIAEGIKVVHKNKLYDYSI